MFLLRRGKSKPSKTSKSRSTPTTPHFGLRAVSPSEGGHGLLGEKGGNIPVGLNSRELALQGELAELREQAEVMRERMRFMNLERETGVRERGIREREVEEARRRVEEMERRVREAEREGEELRREVEEGRRTVALLEERVQLTDELLRAKDGALSNQERRQASLAASQANLLSLLQAKTIELEAAQVFLDRVDNISEDDVVRGVHHLNASILETAVAMADALQYESKHRTLDEDRVPPEKATNRVKEQLGPSMVQQLQDCPHREDAAVVIQIAFQGCMVLHCAWIIAAWHFDYDLCKEGKLLMDVYEHVRQSETQIIAGRWRSVTRKHIQSMRHGDSESFKTPLITYLVKRVVDVLLVAGCSSAKAPQVHEMIVNVYGDRLDTLVHIALGLNRVVGIDAQACDYEPVWTRPDVPFNPVWMEDRETGEGGEAGWGANERVLCTTGLGLRKKVKAAPGRRRKGRSELKSMLVLKPRVALESLLVAGQERERVHPEVRNSWSGVSELGSDGSDKTAREARDKVTRA